MPPAPSTIYLYASRPLEEHPGFLCPWLKLISAVILFILAAVVIAIATVFTLIILDILLTVAYTLFMKCFLLVKSCCTRLCEPPGTPEPQPPQPQHPTPPQIAQLHLRIRRVPFLNAWGQLIGTRMYNPTTDRHGPIEPLTWRSRPQMMVDSGYSEGRRKDSPPPLYDFYGTPITRSDNDTRNQIAMTPLHAIEEVNESYEDQEEPATKL